MIVPSIDLMNQRAVQLIGGETLEIDAGDARPIADRFGRVGEVAVIDLDAALGRKPQTETVRDLLQRARCRVGGGIRSAQAAIDWLDAGAEKVILGTAATPEILSQLPKGRVIAALDARNGEVLSHGWTRGTGTTILERIEALRPYVGGFLITFVEREGRLGGTCLDRVPELVEAAQNAKVTIAGGITTAEEVAALDHAGADAQVGMALYGGQMSLAEGFAAPLRSDRSDGLWPTVVCDTRGVALGMVYSNVESLTRAIDTGTGVYWSRKRGLWQKGATSGATQRLIRLDVDCDRDCLRAVVEQAGSGFCHLDQPGCFGAIGGLGALDQTLRARVADAPVGSYTRKLIDNPAILGSKIMEEASELVEATSTEEVCWETADELYFSMVRATAAGVSLAQVERELDRRAQKVTRRSDVESPC